jgi:hypothetical protein
MKFRASQGMKVQATAVEAIKIINNFPSWLRGAEVTYVNVLHYSQTNPGLAKIFPENHRR